MMEKIKSWLGVAAALAIGVLAFLLRSQKQKTEDAQVGLAKAVFKNETQENDHAYIEAKNNADDLVDDYQRARGASLSKRDSE